MFYGDYTREVFTGKRIDGLPESCVYDWELDDGTTLHPNHGPGLALYIVGSMLSLGFALAAASSAQQRPAWVTIYARRKQAGAAAQAQAVSAESWA